MSTEATVPLYDFRRPTRILRGRQATLQALYGVAAKSLESWLTGRMRSQIEVEVESVEQVSCADYLPTLDSPCATFIYEIEESGGQQLAVTFGRDLVFTLLDRLLGGAGEPQVETRILTPLERRVMRVVADHTASDLAAAWADQLPLTTIWRRFEALPEMIQIAAPEDDLLVTSLRVAFHARSSSIVVAIPFSVLRGFFSDGPERRAHGPKGNPEERRLERALVEGAVRATGMTVAVRLPVTAVAMRTLAALRPGDVLPTRLPVDSLAEIHIQDSPRFRARVGRRGDQVSAQIVDEVVAVPSSPDPNSNAS